MLTEVTKTRQYPGERLRRWFTSQEQDLYLWQDEDGSIAAFQLCYSKYRDERAIYWKEESGFAHLSIDDGESGRSSRTPLCRPAGHFDRNAVLGRFRKLSVDLPPAIIEFVVARLLEYPSNSSSALASSSWP